MLKYKKSFINSIRSKVLYIFAIVSFLSFQNLFAQENIKIDSVKSTNGFAPNGTQAEEGDVKFTDGLNELLRITDEGSFGTIELKNGVPSTTTNKLYNDAGTLKFNGASLGSGSGATQLDELSDAKYNGTNLFIGDNAGFTDNTTTSRNMGIGTNTLSQISTGSYNTAIGYESLIENSSGSNNTSLGYLSNWKNKTGSSNTVVGYHALLENISGSRNTAVGYQALYTNTVGNNTAVGYKSLFANTTGLYNVGLGGHSLEANDVGEGNVGIGYNALLSNTGGNTNVAMGQGAMYFNTTGSNNIGIGFQANVNNSLGSNNTIIGHQAAGASGNLEGSVFIGFQAGYSETNSNRLYIDNSSTSSPLIWGNFINNLAAINGKLGVGRMDPTAILDVKSSGGDIPIRAEVGSQTKFQVFPNGGTSVGTDTQPATNGLTVEGDVDVNSNATIGGDAEIDGNTVLNGNTVANGTTQIGVNGTPFSEIMQITGFLDATDNTTDIAFPSTDFTIFNTVILALQLSGDIGFPVRQQFNTYDGTFGDMSASISTGGIHIEIEDNSNRGSFYKLVLMRMD